MIDPILQVCSRTRNNRRKEQKKKRSETKSSRKLTYSFVMRKVQIGKIRERRRLGGERGREQRLNEADQPFIYLRNTVLHCRDWSGDEVNSQREFTSFSLVDREV